jgi:Ras GTPase-activating-like protein IQGAP2/3
MKTGEAVKLSPDASDAEIFENDQVKAIVKDRVKQLLGLADLFVDAILGSLSKFPYGLRWICRDIKQALHEKFKEASDADVSLVIGYARADCFCCCLTLANMIRIGS